jgi:hypothetical protein
VTAERFAVARSAPLGRIRRQRHDEVIRCRRAAAWARRLYVDSVYTAELSHRGLRWRLTLDGRRVIESQQHTVDVV